MPKEKIQNNISDQLKALSPDSLIETLKTLPSVIQDALVVRLADNVTMFGKTFYDNVSTAAKNGDTRYSIQVHPYPWASAGASNIVIYRNRFGSLSVVLVHNKRRDIRKDSDQRKIDGIPDSWKLPEGYLHPKLCQGGENGLSLIPSEYMDEAEEKLLNNFPIDEAYKTTKEKYKFQPSLPASNKFQHDNTLINCALRESEEEVGIHAKPEQVHFVWQFENNKRIHLINSVYSIDVNSKSSYIDPPELVTDGIEIGEAIWAKLSGFKFEMDLNKKAFRILHEYDVEVEMRYALLIGKAIIDFRNREIERASTFMDSPLFANRKNLESRILQILQSKKLNPRNEKLPDILGISPEEHLKELGIEIDFLPGNNQKEKSENFKALASLGKYAQIYHEKLIEVGIALAKGSVDKRLTVEQLIKIAQEGPELKKDLIASGIKLLPIPRSILSNSEDSSEMERILNAALKYSTSQDPKLQQLVIRNRIKFFPIPRSLPFDLNSKPFLSSQQDCQDGCNPYHKF